MKPLFICKKCIVRSMCNKKCDKIRKALHILDIIQRSSIVTMCLSWAFGFGLQIGTDVSETGVFISFIGMLILSVAVVSVTNHLKLLIGSKFNSDDSKHISRYC